MIEEILPDAVAVADAFDDASAEPIFPEEEPVVARAVEGRKRAFATARTCARRALGGLGIEPVAIPQGEKGEPVWPPGVVGSITHCDGYRAAVAARSREVASVGIDAEPNGSISEGAFEMISLPEERAWVRSAPSDAGVSWDRLLFSAKESVYKAWFPLARRWLGFGDASIRFDAGAGTFEARLLVPGPVVDGQRLTGFSGRWMAGNGLVVTAIAMPALGNSPG